MTLCGAPLNTKGTEMWNSCPNSVRALPDMVLAISPTKSIITPERQKTHNFSNSYYVSHQAALTKPELANITSFKGLDGHRVEVLSGSIQEEIIQQMGISTTNKDMVFPLIKSLVNEQTDAVVLDSGILQYYQQQQADMNFGLMLDKQFGDDPYGIVVKKDNTELLNQVNQGLANIRQNGKYQQIEQKWFGQ